jgi:hypothetical protein
MYTIIENGEQFDFTDEEFSQIEHLVYKSGDGDLYNVLENRVSEFMQMVLLMGEDRTLNDALDFENELGI